MRKGRGRRKLSHVIAGIPGNARKTKPTFAGEMWCHCDIAGCSMYKRKEDSMAMKDIAPWRWGGLQRRGAEERPFDPFRQELGTLHREMDRLFEDFWHGRPSQWLETAGHGAVMPCLDETEDEKAYHIAVELPGMDEKDVEVTLSDGQLIIRGEKKREEEEKAENFYRKERSFGTFCRRLPLPGAVDEDKIAASFRNGILTVDLPKSEEALKKVKHIDVKAA
jgi:HSP20 family protein